MAFWTDGTLKDPKRNYRFVVELLAYPNGATWYAKTVDKPKFNITSTSHIFLNHTFNYPGRVEWQDVSVTLVDPVQPDAVANTMAIISNAGYKIPNAPTGDQLSTISKARAIGALKGVVIKQIGSEGADDIQEQWTLNNAFITNIDLGNLDYSNEELSTIGLTIKYDWATCYLPEGSAVDISGQPAGTSGFKSLENTFFTTGRVN